MNILFVRHKIKCHIFTRFFHFFLFASLEIAIETGISFIQGFGGIFGNYISFANSSEPGRRQCVFNCIFIYFLFQLRNLISISILFLDWQTLSTWSFEFTNEFWKVRSKNHTMLPWRQFFCPLAKLYNICFFRIC